MEPFTISVADTELDDLRARLERTRYATSAPGDPWVAGVPPEYLRELVDYWREGYDWRYQEARLNAYPQFVTEIAGAMVHFVHLRSDNPDAIPIILGHGWPYTFVEMLPLADELGDFSVVVPSLPGYGFSGVPAAGAVTGESIAQTWHALMAQLGYDRYLTYGEDIGAGASDWLAALHPESVRGIHASHAGFPPRERRDDLSPVETDFFEWLRDVWSGGEAYSEMQATRPDTLAASLSDSPAGLAAWIVEKFREWSDTRGELESSFSKDQLLTTVMIYWITNSIATSFRPYYDHHRATPLPLITVPAGVTVQQHEKRYPRELADRTYADVRFFHLLERGGHFTAAEAPDLVAADIRSFVATLHAE
ncbi:MAG TPA: epoxide hydrolase [Galbitalea sp.]|jgi:pimeloyl-ACP methyl ester carboxylesterase|nr:epoxide hydrolase [Galbitalea sp.]